MYQGGSGTRKAIFKAAMQVAEERPMAEAAAAARAKLKAAVKFRDAVGRKFSFPFELCRTWSVGWHLFTLLKRSNANIGIGYGGID
jgi:hypothetical protein